MMTSMKEKIKQEKLTIQTKYKTKPKTNKQTGTLGIKKKHKEKRNGTKPHI